MKKSINYLLFFIFSVNLLVFICAVPSNGKFISKKAYNTEAREKYLLATDLIEQAFGDVDIYRHLILDEEAFALAIENFVESCELNYAKSCSEIGSFYANGNDLLKQDKRKAIYFLEKALLLGDYSKASALLYSYYSKKDYGKTINFARYLLNSKHLKSVRDENLIFYYLKEVYGDRNSNFLNYTKAYACCSILSKADNIVTTQMCNNYISELSPNEVEDAKQLISKWIVNDDLGG